ncbi:transmembrane protein 266 isoform X2 [Myotis myotis]|uniref:transmembrane protein 266 isoform X2 n=1 Tax=Myotis myotis TaxID=51298 RepID=UPI00174E1C99|nr:transmembrane protein 266 isoform X2 [Myotis myotis]
MCCWASLLDVGTGTEDAGQDFCCGDGSPGERERSPPPCRHSAQGPCGRWADGPHRSTWLRPCCGKRAAVWQVFLLSARLNCVLVACVVLVVTLLTLELLIDIKLLQFSSAFQFAGVIHWISLAILSVFFSETVLRIVVLGIWDYIENKIEVFDGAVIVLSLAPMVASTVANGPRSPWDAISLIILLRIWRVKRVIDAYVLPVKVELELVIQQYEKAKVVQDEQLERLTQICQEQGFEIRQLRAHLAQQDLDLAAEREEALRAPQVLRPRSRYHVVEDTATEGDAEPLQPSPDSGVPDPAVCVVTTAAIDIHRPDVSSDLFSVDAPLKLSSKGGWVSSASASESASCSTGSSVTGAQSDSSQTLCSSRACSTARPAPLPLSPPPQPPVAETTVQDLLSSLSDDPCPSQGAWDPAPFAQPSPAGSPQTSPELAHRVSLLNRKNQEGFPVLQLKPTLHFQAPTLHRFSSLESKEQTLHRVPEA